jgi:hypothetical protein
VNAERAGDVDRLFSVPLDRFVSERNALVTELKREGDAEAAAEVAALRKPSLVAWTVNRLAYERRRDVDLLLDAGKRLVDAQQASITQGGRGDLDAAQGALRRAVETLIEAARDVLGERASAGTVTRVAETLRSAATSPSGRELLARGRLVDEVSETGWDVVASLTPAPARSKPSPSRKKDDSAARGQQQAELRRLEQARAAAEKRVRSAARREQGAADRLAEAQSARAAAEEELAGLEREIERLRKRA